MNFANIHEHYFGCCLDSHIGRFHSWDWLSVQNLSKLTDKLTDKVKPIIRPKLEPFRFHIKTDYLSDTNYSTDNPSETDDLVSSVRTAIGLDDAFCIDHHGNDYALLPTSVKLLHVLLSDIIKSNTVRKVKVLILSESRLWFVLRFLFS